MVALNKIGVKIYELGYVRNVEVGMCGEQVFENESLNIHMEVAYTYVIQTLPKNPY